MFILFYFYTQTVTLQALHSSLMLPHQPQAQCRPQSSQGPSCSPACFLGCWGLALLHRVEAPHCGHLLPPLSVFLSLHFLFLSLASCPSPLPLLSICGPRMREGIQCVPFRLVSPGPRRMLVPITWFDSVSRRYAGRCRAL